MASRTPNIGLARPDFDQRQWQDDINDNATVLDALWAKFFATTGLAGVWQNATVYTVGTLVVDETLGTIWRSEITHTSPTTGTFLAARTAQPTYWSNYTIGVRYKGAWSSGAAYAIGDFVVADSSKFAVANIAHTAGSAFNTSGGVWEILIDTTAAASSIAAAVSSAGMYATAAGVSASAAGTYATAAGTYATAAALSAAMAAAGVIWCGTGTGADDIVLTAASFVILDGATVAWRQPSDNTTTVRLNPNGTGLKALLDAAGAAVAAPGTLKADRLYSARYSSTTSKFEFQGPLASVPLQMDTTLRTGSFNALAGYVYNVNTSGGISTPTLPANTSLVGDEMVGFDDATAAFGTNNCTLTAGTGSTIMGGATFPLNISYVGARLRYRKATTDWRIVV